MNERTLPETYADLFELLQALFGFGDYDDEANDEPPWFKFRMTEIAKIKRYCESHRISPKTLAITAYYCHDRRIPVESFGYLGKYTKDALQAHRRLADRIKREEATERLQGAVERSVELGMPEWTDRLLRTPVGSAEKAIQEFEEAQDDQGDH